MRFDDEFYLQDYKQGHFPKIHDDLFTNIAARMSGTSCIDLCGNHGLLGQRIIDVLEVPCILIEMSESAIEMAKRYETSIPKYKMKITKDTYPQVAELIAKHKVDVLVARRCISELFTSTEDPDRFEWEKMLADSGVKEVFLQGRAPTKNATHPLPNVDAEIKCFPTLYTTKFKAGQIAYLKRI